MRVVGRRVSSHLGLANAGNRVLGCRVSSDLGWADPAQPMLVGPPECYQVLAIWIWIWLRELHACWVFRIF